MKIAFVIANIENGGAQRTASIITNGLAECGHEMTLLLFNRSEQEYTISDSVQILAMCNSFPEYTSQNYLHRLTWLRKKIREIKPDVAIGFTEGGYALFLATIGFHIYKIASARINPRTILFGKGIRGHINRLWFRCADRVVLQNASQERIVPERLWKTIVIPNPITEALEMRIVPDYAERVQKIIMVGRLDAQKNYRIAIDAIHKVHDIYPNVKMDIFGKGSLSEELKHQTEALALSEVICFKGWNGDVVSEYQKHDLFILTSDYEGMPNALIEAMASGLPCISTDCETGPSDLIVDGIDGFLVPVGDVVTLATKICEVIKMPLEQRAVMGMAAQNKILRSYRRKAVIEKWEKLLKEFSKNEIDS